MKDTNCRLRGVLTELVTPFDQALQIDHSSLKRMVDFQVTHGIRGLFLHGISAESLTMTDREQVAFVTSAVKAAEGRIPVVANLMCSGKERAREFLCAFTDSGADAICMSQPLMLPYSDEALLDYFSSVIERTSLPVYLYNMPQAGYTLSPGLIGTLARRFPHFCGYKDSTQNIIHLQSVISAVDREDFSILAGSDATFHATLAAGGAGIVSLISLLFPDMITRLYDAYQAGDYKAAFQQQLYIMKVRDALKAAPLIAGYKTVAKYLDLYETDQVRAPLVDTRPEQVQKLIAKLDALQAF